MCLIYNSYSMLQYSKDALDAIQKNALVIQLA